MTDPPAPGATADAHADGRGDAAATAPCRNRVRLRDDPRSLALLAILAAPYLVGAAAVLGDTWWPASDLALLDLRIRDVGTAHTPVLGPFSRFGWSHPGPLLYWLLAPAYNLFGATATASLAAAALQNALVAAGAGVAARRVAGRDFLVLFALAATAFARAAGGEVLVSTWNPWIALAPFVVLVLLTWGLANGDLDLAPWWVVAASYLVQSHVGYAAVVVALGTWAGAAVAWHAWHGWRSRAAAGGADASHRDGGGWPDHRRRLVRSIGVGVVLGAASWVGPVIDQLTNEPGNLRAIVSYFRSSDMPAVGFGVADGVAARQLSPVAPWFGGSERLDFLARLAPTSVVWAAPVVAAFLATAWWAWRRRERDLLHLHVTAAVGVLAGWVATSRITDQPYYYLFRWWWVLAMAVWLAAAWSALRLAPRGWTLASGRVVVPAAVAVTVVLGGLASLDATDPIEPDTHNVAVEVLTPQLTARLDPGATYVVRPIGFSWFETFFGLLNQLDRHDVGVLVDPTFTSHAGARRTLGDPAAPDDEPAGTLLVATGSAVPDSRDDPALEELATYDPLTDDERVELERLQGEQRQRLVDAGRADLGDRVENEGIELLATVEPSLDPVAAARIAELLRRGERVSVFRER